jgi:GDPmannose 4,6-dehydratase
MAFLEAGIELDFDGKNENEFAVIRKCNHPEIKLPAGKKVLLIDKKYYRPAEVDILIGDATKAQQKLGWKPRYDLKAIVKEMVASDLNLFNRDKYLREGGHKIINYHEI